MTVSNGKTFGSPGEIKSTRQHLFAFQSQVLPLPTLTPHPNGISGCLAAFPTS